MTLSPLPRWLRTALDYMLQGVFAALLFPFFSLLLGAQWWCERYGPTSGVWQRWFAWRPVRLDGSDRVVWLETVERTVYGNSGTYYRRPGDESVHAPWDYGYSDEEG